MPAGGLVGIIGQQQTIEGTGACMGRFRSGWQPNHVYGPGAMVAAQKRAIMKRRPAGGRGAEPGKVGQAVVREGLRLWRRWPSGGEAVNTRTITEEMGAYAGTRRGGRYRHHSQGDAAHADRSPPLMVARIIQHPRRSEAESASRTSRSRAAVNGDFPGIRISWGASMVEAWRRLRVTAFWRSDGPREIGFFLTIDQGQVPQASCCPVIREYHYDTQEGSQKKHGGVSRRRSVQTRLVAEAVVGAMVEFE